MKFNIWGEIISNLELYTPSYQSDGRVEGIFKLERFKKMCLTVRKLVEDIWNQNKEVKPQKGVGHIESWKQKIQHKRSKRNF